VAGLSPGALSNGKFSQDDIRKILDANSEVFGECYTLGAGGKNKAFTGTVKVKATVGPSGDVKAVEVLKSDTKNKKVDACVSDAFKKIKFPAPKNGATSVITFPIGFGSLEEVK
jgi:TonB family protein